MRPPLRYLLLVVGCLAACDNVASFFGPDAGADSPDLIQAPTPGRAEPRSDGAYGYDPRGKRVYFFGGDDGPIVAQVLRPRYHDDLWIYDLATGDWTASSRKGPMARGRAAFAMDTVRGRLLVALGRYRPENAGNSTGYTLLQDAWGYETATANWIDLNPGGVPPAGRQAPAAVFDADDDRMVMFGGDLSRSFGSIFDHQATNETWELRYTSLRGYQWTKLTPNGTSPPARYMAAAALDDKRARMILVGGVDDMGTFFNDVWAFDLSTDTWSRLSDGRNGPSERLGLLAAYDADGDRVIVFAGHDLSALGHVNDTFAFALGNNTWSQLGDGDQEQNGMLGCAGQASEQPYDFTAVDATSPERRERGMFVNAGDRLVLYGGEGDCAQLDDTWTFAAGKWSRAIPAAHGESCMRRGEQCACLCN